MIASILFFLLAGAFLAIVVLQGREITGLKKYCHDTTARLASLRNEFEISDDSFEKMAKKVEWLELKSGAPMTLILDQKTPLKVLVKQVQKKEISQRPPNTDKLLATAVKQINDL